MNTIRRFCAAFLLALTLTVSSFAGEIHFPGATQPPPPSDETTTSNGDMQYGVTDENNDDTDSTLEAALSLLRVVLSIM